MNPYAPPQPEPPDERPIVATAVATPADYQWASDMAWTIGVGWCAFVAGACFVRLDTQPVKQFDFLTVGRFLAVVWGMAVVPFLYLRFHPPRHQ